MKKLITLTICMVMVFSFILPCYTFAHSPTPSSTPSQIYVTETRGYGLHEKPLPRISVSRNLYQAYYIGEISLISVRYDSASQRNIATYGGYIPWRRDTLNSFTK